MAEKLYQVLKIDELQGVDPVKGLVPYYRHTIRTKGGVTLRIDVDQKDFTPEKAGPILEAAAKNADGILHL